MDSARKPLAIDRVWRRLAMLVRAVSPIAVAAGFVLTRARRRLYISWLRPLEAIARRLVFLETLRLRLAPPRLYARASKRTQSAPPRLECVFAPHAWRAPFRITPRPARPRARRSMVTIKLPDDGYPCSRVPQRPVAAMGVARRIEALRRVIADPAPRALRFARTLARLNVRAKLEAIGESFAPLKRAASYGKSGLLLAIVQADVDAASAQLGKAHALAGWDSS